ncbi:MAG: polymer-forming cytoskeletal protein [Thermomicrobium sp.]|nr:polymer-forming cytoskeletal protein [Thermomicrobium sp.]
MRRLVAFLLVAGAFAAVWLRVRVAHAAELLAGSSPTVGVDQRIDDDLYVAGNAIDISGEVTRDVFAAGSMVTIAGRVGGDVTAAGGLLRGSGPIVGSLRAAGSMLEVTGPVGWDLVAVGVGTATVGRTATIAHDVAVLEVGTLTIEGTVRGSVRGSVGTLVVAGRVFGDIDVEADRVEIRDGARIDGALRYRSPQPATIAPGARIDGRREYTPTTRAQGEPRTALERALDWIMTVLLRLAWALVTGTLLVLALPRQTVRAAEALRQAPLWSLLWGAAILVLVPLLVLVLALTVVGLPAALFLLGIYVAVLYVSQILVGIALVRSVPLVPRSERRLPLWLTMAVGTTVVLWFRLLPIPFGWTLWWSLVIGALALGMAWTAVSGWGLRPASATAAVPGASAAAPTQPALSESAPRAQVPDLPDQANEER